jgi:hypothetical protein
MVSRHVIERYGSPNILDHANYGTVCKVSSLHRDLYDIYLQVGEDEQDPEWEHLGTFSHQLSNDVVHDLIDSRLKKNIHYD